MSGINCRKKLLSIPVEVMALLVTFIKFLSELLLAFVFDPGEKLSTWVANVPIMLKENT
jgi:hypothetical protein